MKKERQMEEQRLNEVIITPETLDKMYERYLRDAPLYDIGPPKKSCLAPTCYTVTLIVFVVAVFVSFVCYSIIT